MMRKINKIFVLLIIFTFLFSIPLTAFASDTDNPLEDDRDLEERTEEMFPNSEESDDVGLPEVTLDDANTWIERKGFEIIGFLQKFAQPFAIVVFIFSGLMVLVGAFGNGKLVSKGVFGMFITLIMYVVVLYAPEIMDVFLGWVQN